MSKKPKTDKTTTEPPERTPDDVIAFWLEAARTGISEDLGVRVPWATLEIAALRNTARNYAKRALAPKPLNLPRHPVVNPPRETDPPASPRVPDLLYESVRRKE